MNIEIPDNVLQLVYAHAASGWPEEVCGLLMGPQEQAMIDEVRRCENMQNQLHREDPITYPRDARTAYNLGAKDLFFVQRSLGGPRPVKVIYHSHVDVGAYFSAEDTRAALADGNEPAYPVAYLVVDARKDGAHESALYDWDVAQAQFVERERYRL